MTVQRPVWSQSPHINRIFVDGLSIQGLILSWCMSRIDWISSEKDRGGYWINWLISIQLGDVKCTKQYWIQFFIASAWTDFLLRIQSPPAVYSIPASRPTRGVLMRGVQMHCHYFRQLLTWMVLWWYQPTNPISVNFCVTFIIRQQKNKINICRNAHCSYFVSTSYEIPINVQCSM